MAEDTFVTDTRFVKLLPEHLQMKILSLVASGQCEANQPAGLTVPPPSNTGIGSPGSNMENIGSVTPGSVFSCSSLDAQARDAMYSRCVGAASRVRVHGFSWQDGMISPSIARQLLQAAEQLSPDTLRPAGVGAAATRRRDPNVRGDSVAWIPLQRETSADPIASLPCWPEINCLLANVVRSFNEHVSMHGVRLKLPEKVMLAHYSQGGKYVRHSDVSPLVPHRRVTVIIYLNETWREHHGGELRLHGVSLQQPLDILPLSGRLVLFRSEMEHEVMVTHRPRWALTAWLSLEPSSVASTQPCTMGVMRSLATHVLSPVAHVQCAKSVEDTASSSSHAPAALHSPPTLPATGLQPNTREQANSKLAGPTIFVSIASYRDPETPHTLHSLFAQSSCPSRVFIGVCFQCDEKEDADCFSLEGLPPEWARNVRSIRLPWRDARGPVWARYLIQTHLLQDEDFFLQIDAHTRAAHHWDERLICMLRRCGSSKPVLSSYPLPYEGRGLDSISSSEAHTTLLCTLPTAKAFDKHGMLRFRARLLADAPTGPVPSAFWAAGFSFSSAALAHEVPYDPYLPFLFFGEEVSMAARMWTRGWDVFAPDEHVLFHLWSRCHRSTFWELPDSETEKLASQQRVRQLLCGLVLHDELDPVDCHAMTKDVSISRSGVVEKDTILARPAGDAIWGLGHLRSLHEYEAYSGVDFLSMRATSTAECGGMPGEDYFLDRVAVALQGSKSVLGETPS